MSVCVCVCVCVCIDGRLRLCPHFHLVLRVTAPYSIANTLNPNGRQHQLLYCSRVILVCWLSWVGQLVVVCCCITSSSSSIHWLPMPLTTYVRKPIVPSYVGIHLQNNYTVQMIENRGWAHNGRCRLILKKKKHSSTIAAASHIASIIFIIIIVIITTGRPAHGNPFICSVASKIGISSLGIRAHSVNGQTGFFFIRVLLATGQFLLI